MSVRPTILAAAALSAGLVLAAGAAPVAAQPLEGVAVAYRDLNLNDPAGQATLDRRIARAAEQVCGRFMTVELRWRALSEACQAELIASAQAQRHALTGGERYAALRSVRSAN